MNSDSPEGQRSPKRRKKKTRGALVKEVIEKVEAKITSSEIKPTVGDFIRLLQLERELDPPEQPQEITVSWIDPEKPKDATGE